MKTVKDAVYGFVQERVIGDSQYRDGVQTSEVAESLGLRRCNVSSLLNELVRDGKLLKTQTRPVLYRLPVAQEHSEYSCFETLVGYNGSLRKAVQLAKAAILYPGSSLSIRLSSDRGCGTTCFAALIYEFAKAQGVVKKDAPYVKVNCCHFIKNIDILDEILFGEAGNIEKSSFARARGGVLFVDNVDLLNARQQSRILSFLENKEIISEDGGRRLNCSDCILVLGVPLPAASGGVDWKTPIVIELPPLGDRPLLERYEMIHAFFRTEAVNAKRSIELTLDAARALLTAEYPHNVKELKTEITSACANAYVRTIDEPARDIQVCLSDFTDQIRKSLAIRRGGEEVEELLRGNNFLYYDKEEGAGKAGYANCFDNIYSDIQTQYKELSRRGVNSDSIQNVINTYIRGLFQYFSYDAKKDEQANRDELAKIVDKSVIYAVTMFLDGLKKQFGREYPSNVFYGMCLHLNSLLTMNYVNHKRITDEEVKLVIQRHPAEYAAMSEFAHKLKEDLRLDLNINEIVLLTMFVVNPEDQENHPVLLYAMHGKGIASGLAEVTNSLTHCSNAYGFDLDLTMNSDRAIEALRSQILKIDRGQGVIVIYDMGSMKTMLDIISEEIDVKIRGINMPITLIGIEIARRCSRETDIDYVYHLVNKDMYQLQSTPKRRKSVIITLCHTSEGGAMQLKNYIDRYSRLDMHTVALSISNRDALAKKVLELKKVYDVHAFVGTYDPGLMGIPFISISTVFENRKEDLDRVLMFEPMHWHRVNYDEVYRLLEEQFTHAPINRIKSVLPGVVDEMSIIYGLDDEQRLGAFLHLACLVERLMAGGVVETTEAAGKYILQYPEDYQTLIKIMRTLEKAFHIIINDNEIELLLMIVKRL